MKKLLAIATICMLTTGAMAQGGKMMADQKQKLIDSLGVSSAVADSVMSVQSSYRMKMMGMRGDGQTPMTDDQRKAMATGRDEMRMKLKSYLTDAQITKLEAMQAAQRGMGRRGGGTPPPPPPMQ